MNDSSSSHVIFSGMHDMFNVILLRGRPRRSWRQGVEARVEEEIKSRPLQFDTGLSRKADT